MSFAEKMAWEKYQDMRVIAKKAIAAGHKDFNSVKGFLIDNNLVPLGVDDSRFAACIMQIIRGG